MYTIHFYVVYMAIHFHVACMDAIMKHHRIVLPSAPGRTVAPPVVVGCSWCRDQSDPQVTVQTVDGITSYAGGICDQCVHYFRRQLQSHHWAKSRRVHLQTEPYCRYCLTGRHDAPMPMVDPLTGICHYSTKDTLTPASIVDHVLPWRYFPSRYWDSDNHQSLCSPCHDSKSTIERIDNRGIHR